MSAGDYGNLPSNLDECGGHTDISYPYYHYHVPNKRIFPYTTACLSGCVDVTVWTNFAGIQTAACSRVLNATQYNYTTVAALFLEELQNSTMVAPTQSFVDYVNSTHNYGVFCPTTWLNGSTTITSSGSDLVLNYNQCPGYEGSRPCICPLPHSPMTTACVPSGPSLPAISSLFTLFTPTVCPLRLLPFHQVRLDRRDHG